jgi:hypothetical protein
MPEKQARKRCPYCGESILAVAIRCRYCGEELDEDDDGEAPRRPRRRRSQTEDIKWLVPTDRSGWAIAAGYLGLLSCFPLVGLLFGSAAVATGILALRHCKRDPNLGGRGRAIFGIIAGSILTLMNLLLVVGLIISKFVK